MTGHKSFALIPAAGMGKRMGASINKQYLQLDGMPIVARTIAVFENSPLIDGIMLVIPEEEIPYCREHVVNAYGFAKVIDIIAGGKERQNSVMNGLKALERRASAEDVILIHDGVRPFITPQIIEESIKIAVTGEGALVAVPVKDTIKRATNGLVLDTPDRETLWQAQTPQAFQFNLIYQAHNRAVKDAFTGTDDASLIERLGGAVRILRGDYRNIKITTPEDLVLAEAFLKAYQQLGGNQ